MILEHDNKRPDIHPTATVAANAVVCGDVSIGADTCVGFGAVLTAEGGAVSIGRNCVIMEHAVLRGTRRAPVEVGDNVLIGPGAHLSGCHVGNDCFLATNVSVFPHARIGEGSTVRIGAVVHIRTVLPPTSSIPIQWIAIGDPAQVLSPQEGERLLERLRELDFSATVFGVRKRDDAMGHMAEAMARYTRVLARHRFDREV